MSEYEQCKGRVQKRTDGKLVGDRGGQKEEKRANRIVNCRGNKQLSGGKNGEGAIEWRVEKKEGESLDLWLELLDFLSGRGAF